MRPEQDSEAKRGPLVCETRASAHRGTTGHARWQACCSRLLLTAQPGAQWDCAGCPAAMPGAPTQLPTTPTACNSCCAPERGALTLARLVIIGVGEVAHNHNGVRVAGRQLVQRGSRVGGLGMGGWEVACCRRWGMQGRRARMRSRRRRLDSPPCPSPSYSKAFPARQPNFHTWPMSPTMPSRSGKPGRSVVNDSSSLHPCASSPAGHRGWCVCVCGCEGAGEACIPCG